MSAAGPGLGGVDADLAAAGLPALPRTAWLAIDLDRLAGNLHAIRASLPAGVRVEPVVKADAYGHGAVPVAHALAAAGADGLSVATWDEALELRDAGIDLPILLLYPAPPALAAAAAARRITLTVGDETLLARTLAVWAWHWREAGVAPAERPSLDVQLEVETGLGRGGIAPDRVPAAAGALAAARGVRLTGLWSHLGSPADAIRSSGQAERFEATARALAADGALVRSWHLAASGGLLAGSARPYDAVRPGLSVYGVIPDELVVAPDRAGLVSALQPVLSLRARPVRVTVLAAGMGISYGSAYVTTRPSRIVTLPVGYADGLHRAWTSRVQALVRGHAVPVVGTVAMDAIMADVTDVPPPPVTVDDEFVLLGQQGTRTITAADLARAGTTISWEVLAGMARRLPRVYYAAARAVGLRTLTEDTGQWRGSGS